MTIRSKLTLGVLVGLCQCLATMAYAAPVVVPADLPAGTTYRLVFTTNALSNATSTNIEDYNAFVTSQANESAELATLGTTWTVLGSTAAVDAKTNSATDPGLATGVPIYNLHGDMVASNNADLWDGGLAGTMKYDQYGATLTSYVHTGTSTDGTGIANRQLGSSQGRVQAGQNYVTNSAWTNIGDWSYSTTQLRFYGLSGELTSPVPEPETYALILAGLGLVGLMARQRKPA